MNIIHTGSMSRYVLKSRTSKPSKANSHSWLCPGHWQASREGEACTRPRISTLSWNTEAEFCLRLSEIHVCFPAMMPHVHRKKRCKPALLSSVIGTILCPVLLFSLPKVSKENLQIAMVKIWSQIILRWPCIRPVTSTGLQNNYLFIKPQM